MECGGKNLNNEGLKYCGVFSKISSFPISNIVDIEVNSGEPVTIKVTLSYSVMDRKRIVSNKEKYLRYAMPLFSVFFTKTGITLKYFSIKSKHHQCIFVNFFEAKSNVTSFSKTGHKTEIFDGPGRRSKQLKNVNSENLPEKYISSIFWISVFLFSENQSAHFKFHSVNQSDWVNIQHQENFSLSLPSVWYCKQSFCFMTVQSKNETSFNISLINIKYKGNRMTHNCEFAGIATYDHVAEKILHVATECVKTVFSMTSDIKMEKNREFDLDIFHFHNLSTTEVKYPTTTSTTSVFSQGNKALLIVYAFEEYGTMTFDLNINAIHCQVTNIDLCIAQPSPVYLHNRKVNLGHKAPWSPGCYIVQINQSTTCRRFFSHPTHTSGKRMFLSATRHSNPGLLMKISGSGTLTGIFQIFPSLDFVIKL